MSELRPLTVYLDPAEISKLEREAAEAGRSGVSSQIRWILAARRSTQAVKNMRFEPLTPGWEEKHQAT